jgi:hypothetical protein
MTIEELTKRVAELEGENTKLKADAIENAKNVTVNEDKLRDEAAGYRVKMNEQTKKNYLLSDVIKQNNIKVEDKDLETSGLKLNDGKVEGDATYKPNTNFNIGVDIGSGDPSPAMTVESIQGMSRADIAKNWDAVSAALSAQDSQPNNNTI